MDISAASPQLQASIEQSFSASFESETQVHQQIHWNAETTLR